MAHTKQSLLVFERISSSKQAGQGLLISARTGFQDVTINGTRYYYNERLVFDDLGKVNISNVMAMNINRNKRGIIILSRKK